MEISDMVKQDISLAQMQIETENNIHLLTGQILVEKRERENLVNHLRSIENKIHKLESQLSENMELSIRTPVQWNDFKHCYE